MGPVMLRLVIVRSSRVAESQSRRCSRKWATGGIWRRPRQGTRTMTRLSERIPQHIPLGADRPGTQRTLLVHRYGDPDARPKAYLQAALHADETPALLVAHHLVAAARRRREKRRDPGPDRPRALRQPDRPRPDRQPGTLGPLRAGRRRQLQPQLARPLRARLRAGLRGSSATTPRPMSRQYARRSTSCWPGSRQTRNWTACA